MNVQYDPDLLKKLKKVDVRIRKNFFEKITLFETNHQNPVLNNHALKREYLGYRSIDVTADWRAIYEEVPTSEGAPFAYFIIIGTHDELYNRKPAP